MKEVIIERHYGDGYFFFFEKYDFYKKLSVFNNILKKICVGLPIDFLEKILYNNYIIQI